jgi:hypothetical protein
MTGYFCIGVISDYMCRGYTAVCYSPCLDVYSLLEILMSTLKGKKRDIYYDIIIKSVSVHTVQYVPSKAPPLLVQRCNGTTDEIRTNCGMEC